MTLSEESLGHSGLNWKDLEQCLSNFKVHKDHLRVLLSPDAGSVAFGVGLQVSIFNELSGDAANDGPWTALLVTRLDHPDSGLPLVPPENSRTCCMGTLQPDPPEWGFQRNRTPYVKR